VRYGFAGVADKTGHTINIFDRSREVSITQRRLRQELLLTSRVERKDFEQDQRCALISFNFALRLAIANWLANCPLGFGKPGCSGIDRFRDTCCFGKLQTALAAAIESN
jgi:hypothetical protein